MEFIIYLCFKCTYKLLKCACSPMFTPNCVYNVCFHFCNALEPEQSHNAVGKPQTAHCYFFALFALFADLKKKKNPIVLDSQTP